MTIYFGELGEVEVVIEAARETCDAFVKSAYSVTLERELTEEELQELDSAYSYLVQEAAAEMGAFWS